MEHFGRLAYLASPLTHADPEVRSERTAAVSRACGWLMNNRQDIFVFSPIAHADRIASVCSLPYQWEFWAAIDECMLSRCEEIWVLCIPGFKKSTGVNAERVIAKRLGIPCKFVVPVLHASGTDLTELHVDHLSYVVTDVEPDDAP